MKVTLNWLKDFVDIDIPAEELAEKLTSAGFEVEELLYQNKYLHDVVVGKILKIERHPQADKLVVCQVDIGDKTTQIITAATNVFEGAIVPVSLPGADLINGIKISVSKLRGVESFGMFCSGEELGIDDNYFEGASVNGILILPEDFIPGTPIDKALNLDDVIFDINVTPNRPDCNSVLGIAREVCAVLSKQIKDIDCSYETVKNDNIQNYIDIEVKTENCPSYMGAVVKNLKIERSPMWVRSRLNAVGIKPINTIVDITNYVLIEQGQPMHAFDYENIEGKKIIVRQAEKEEKIAVLNQNSYILDENDMVIADTNKPMVIAGVIGGLNSCINNDTKITVFESASFNLKSIRITSKKLGVRTDSSARYEKGVSPVFQELGLKRALNLVYKMQCGEIVEGIIDRKQVEIKEKNLVGSLVRIDKILGIEIDREKIKQILNNLGIKTEINGDVISYQPPVCRDDIENENDLAEEIIRIYGYDVYDNFEGALFENSKVTEGKYHDRFKFENNLKNQLVDYGYYEVLNYSLYPSNACEKLLINDERVNCVKIMNSLSEDLSTLRTVMAHSILSNISYNLSVNNKNLRFFEVGRVYLPKELPLQDQPVEQNKISMAVCYDGFNFFNMKHDVLALLEGLNLEYDLVYSKQPYLHPGVSADIVTKEGNVIGCFGKLHPTVAKNYDLPKEVYYAELDTDYLSSLTEKQYKVKEVPKYPIVERDLALLVKEEVSNKELYDSIKSSCGKMFYDLALFDVYRSDSFGENIKSMAYNLRLNNIEKTMTDEEVNQIIKKVLKALEYKFGAKLREL